MPLTGCARFDPRLSDVVGLLDGAQASLKEAESALSDYLGRLELDDGRLAEVTGRLDTITRLEEKYHRNLEGLIDYRADIDRRLREWQQQAGDEGALHRHIEELESNLSRLGASLTARRREGGPMLATPRGGAAVRSGHACMLVLFVPLSRAFDDQGIAVGDERFKASETGLDVVEFLIAPNPGEGLRPLREIASGGELSRIMLALKTVFAENDAIPTMVFDEVDAGIGGETGLAVAAKLASLGAYRQVIVVTHLPTIARGENALGHLERPGHGRYGCCGARGDRR